MYNGIGLSTPRGSATSGYVTKNLTYIKPEFFRNKLSARSGHYEGAEDAKRRTKGNEEILRHNEKRAIEAKLFELQEVLLEQGLTDEEIETKLAAVSRIKIPLV